MKYQTKAGMCGPSMLVNILRCFGKRISERSIAKLSGTTDLGTNEYGLQSALTQLGFSFEEIRYNTRDEAWDWLLEQLQKGRAIGITIQDDDHWVCVIGLVAGRAIVVDSSNSKRNKKENGVHIFDKIGLGKIWRNKKINEFYGLAVYKND